MLPPQDVKVSCVERKMVVESLSHELGSHRVEVDTGKKISYSCFSVTEISHQCRGA